MNNSRSAALFERALRVIPGGVNSPVRAFRAVGGDPVFISHGEGSYLFDADGNRYLDCIGSWGPLLFGHAHPAIVEAVASQLPLGTTYGAPTELEVLLAEAIVRYVPSIEKVRLVSSGTEATMSAIRVARGFTGRSVILKFEGCYHGHADFLLAKAGSGVATLGLPECAGVPGSVTADTLTVPYNDVESVQRLFEARGSEIACIILEPVAGNMGCVAPETGYLEFLRSITRQYGALLIFDEVMTGFRLGRGGAQERFGVTPDLTTLGKIVGGGMPLGAYGGTGNIMDAVAPIGPVYQAGTLSGNPVAVSAGLAMLKLIEDAGPELYTELDRVGIRWADALRHGAAAAGVDVTVNQVGSMVTPFFTGGAVTDYATAQHSDRAKFAVWFRSMLASGVYWPPSQFEAAFLGARFGEAELDLLSTASATAFKEAGQM